MKIKVLNLMRFLDPIVLFSHVGVNLGCLQSTFIGICTQKMIRIPLSNIIHKSEPFFPSYIAYIRNDPSFTTAHHDKSYTLPIKIDCGHPKLTLT